MPFSIEDNALIFTIENINAIPVQRIRLTEDTDGIFEDHLQKRRTGHYWKTLGKQKVPTKGTRAADRSTRVVKNTTVAGVLVLSPEDQPQTRRSIHQIPRDGSSLTVQHRMGWSVSFIHHHACCLLRHC